MRRLFYVAVGVGVGVAGVRRLSKAASKAASKMTPSGLAGTVAQSFGGAGESLRGFVDDVRRGMAEREVELHQALTSDGRDGRPTRER